MPEINVTGPGFQPTIQLDHDFGQSPVGRLGDRTVQQLGPGEPRTKGGIAGFFQSIRDLGSRLLDVLKPPQVRAGEAYRRGLEQTSAQVGELLGALSKTREHRVDGLEARKLLDTLPMTAEPLTSSGTAFDDVFGARVDVHLKNMTPKQLVALQDGLKLAGNSELRSDPLLQVISGKVNAELEKRIESESTKRFGELVDRALGQLPREQDHPGSVNFIYERNFLLGAIEILRDFKGMDTTTEDQRREHVKVSLQRMLDSGAVKDEQLLDLFEHLDTRELSSLLHSGDRTSLEGMDTILRECIRHRTRDLDKAFLKAATVALDNPGVDGINKAVRELQQLQTHCKVHGLPLDRMTEKRLSELTALVEKESGNLDTGGLGDQQLRDSLVTLTHLGIEPGRDKLQLEMTTRRQHDQARYTEVIARACTCARSGDFTGMLRTLEETRTLQDEAFLRHQTFEGKRIIEGDKVLAYRGSLLTQALQSLNEDELAGLWGALSSVDGRMVSSGLSTVGLAMYTDNPQLARQMLTAVTDLEMLDVISTDLLKARGFKLPPLPDQTLFEAGQLDEKARGTLREVFGVEIGPNANVNVRTGYAPVPVQDKVKDNLEEMNGEGTKEFLLDGEHRTGIDEAMWKDIGRAGYQYRDSEGITRELVDRDGFKMLSAQDQTARRLAGVEILKDITSGNETQMLSLSHLVNQNGLAGLQYALMSEDSPIRLPDGTPGRLIGGEHTTYNIRKGDDGTVVVTFDFSQRDPTHFFNPLTGEQKEVDGAQSRCHFTFEITVDPKGKMTMSQPLEFLYDVTLAPEPPPEVTVPPPSPPWQGEPRNLQDIIDTTDPKLRQDFRDYMESRFMTESWNFLEEHSEFIANPTLEGARQLAARFIGPGSKEDVNVPDNVVNDIVGVLEAEGASQMTAPQLVKLYEGAFGEVCGMLQFAPFDAFMEQRGKA